MSVKLPLLNFVIYNNDDDDNDENDDGYNDMGDGVQQFLVPTNTHTHIQIWPNITLRSIAGSG